MFKGVEKLKNDLREMVRRENALRLQIAPVRYHSIDRTTHPLFPIPKNLTSALEQLHFTRRS